MSLVCPKQWKWQIAEKQFSQYPACWVGFTSIQGKKWADIKTNKLMKSNCWFCNIVLLISNCLLSKFVEIYGINKYLLALLTGPTYLYPNDLEMGFKTCLTLFMTNIYLDGLTHLCLHIRLIILGLWSFHIPVLANTGVELVTLNYHHSYNNQRKLKR